MYMKLRSRWIYICLGVSLLCNQATDASAFLLSSETDPNNSLIKEYSYSSNPNSVRIVVKDNIDIKSQVTSAGSLALADNVASTNAFLVNKLIETDYVIIGKANLSEWANFRSTNSVSGWSSYGGQTTHPLGNEFNPCGSSSGSAVAVASGIVNVSIGTETNGSISCPASINGIVGFKPTVGLVSRSGIVPISSSQDTAGPMGRTVAQIAKLLEIISGFDSNDPATHKIPEDFDFNFHEATLNSNLDGLRFGLLDPQNQSDEIKTFHKKLKSAIESLGGELVTFKDTRVYPSDQEYYVLLYEFREGLERYLKNSNSKIKTLEDIIAFNDANSDKVMPHFGQDILYLSSESRNIFRYWFSKWKLKNSYRDTLDILEQNKLDAFIGLTRGPAWRIDYIGGDSAAIKKTIRFGNGGYAAHTGMPHITIPFFTLNKFPVGVSIIGARWTDKEIISYASALEKFIDLNNIQEVSFSE